MTMRPRAIAHPIPSFGRRAPACVQHHEQRRAQGETSGLGNDLRLFALTFAGGFLFMSVYLA